MSTKPIEKKRTSPNWTNQPTGGLKLKLLRNKGDDICGGQLTQDSGAGLYNLYIHSSFLFLL